MKIGVIGAGVMGSGIAHAFAAHEGYEVTLCDIKQEYAKNGKNRIEKVLAKQVEKGKISHAEVDVILGRIIPAENSGAADCELMIEAAVEDMELKKSLFSELSRICRKDAVFASNTSSLSITEISAGLDRPVIGMHFFNPAAIMKLVEVAVGINTPPELIEKIRGIAESIGKTPVLVQDSAGFVVNRVLIPMINEAVGLLAEGVASAEDIDEAIKLGANHPIGPLALGDLIGLDVCLAIMEILHQEFGDAKYRPHPLMRKMVRGGMLGRKTGKGFFIYR